MGRFPFDAKPIAHSGERQESAGLGQPSCVAMQEDAESHMRGLPSSAPIAGSNLIARLGACWNVRKLWRVLS